MLNKQIKVYLGFLVDLRLFFTTVFPVPTLFTSMSSLFCITRERNMLLQRG